MKKLFDKTPETIEDTEIVSEFEDTTEETEEKTKHPILEMIQFAFIALLIVIPIRTFIAQPFIVSGESMENTFLSGQYLIVDQISYRFEEPERGEVIVFRYPRDPSTFFIKRIIGLPGDTVTIEGDIVTVTNEANPGGFTLTEDYIKSMEDKSFVTEELGDREYFVMGDNRDRSSDSRVWGVLQEENIVGRAFVRLFPIGTIDVLPGEVSYANEKFVTNKEVTKE